MLKAIARAVLPDSVVRKIQKHRQLARKARLSKLTSPKEVFTTIYLERMWGDSGEKGRPFFSGSGSSTEVMQPYVAAVSSFLRSLPQKPDLVDLGCGDFAVGSELRALCGSYVACDVVQPLIDFNKQKFAELSVDFRVLDIAADELPLGDVACIRQVLQHLSNAYVEKFVKNVQGRYRFLVVTEHLPTGRFVPNLDKTTADDIRLISNSGLILTAPPFDLKVRSEKVICEVAEQGGTIRTIVYELAQY